MTKRARRPPATPVAELEQLVGDVMAAGLAECASLREQLENMTAWHDDIYDALKAAGATWVHSLVDGVEDLHTGLLEAKAEALRFDALFSAAARRGTLLRDALTRAKDALNRDKTGLAAALGAIVKRADGAWWVTESRGPYAWDDDRYREEAASALDAMAKLAREALKASGNLADVEFRAIETTLAEATWAAAPPIPMVLHCPVCALQHVDEGEWIAAEHRTHLCAACGNEWRPSNTATIGVKALARARPDESEEPEKPRWLVVIAREGVPEVTRFGVHVEALEYFDRASTQWSDSYLARVEVGPGDPRPDVAIREEGR